MNTLRRMQRAFFGGVSAGDPARFPRTAVTTDFTAEQRAAVYIEAYRLRLADALHDNYPALHTLLGDDAFFEMAAAYIEMHPSRHVSIRYFGDRLAQFLATHRTYQQEPVLAEMACFEWALRDVFDAADVPAACIGDLTHWPPEQWGALQFRAHPALRRLELTWNVPDLWQAIKDQESQRVPERHAEATAWFIWRHELRSYFESRSRGERRAFDSLVGGANFGNLCESLAHEQGEEQGPVQAASYLSSWLSRGWLVRCAE